MTTKKDNRVLIQVDSRGRFTAPIRLFRHSRYKVARGRDGELIFTPVPDSAFPPKETVDDKVV